MLVHCSILFTKAAMQSVRQRICSCRHDPQIWLQSCSAPFWRVWCRWQLPRCSCHSDQAPPCIAACRRSNSVYLSSISPSVGHCRPCLHCCASAAMLMPLINASGAHNQLPDGPVPVLPKHGSWAVLTELVLQSAAQCRCLPGFRLHAYFRPPAPAGVASGCPPCRLAR